MKKRIVLAIVVALGIFNTVNTYADDINIEQLQLEKGEKIESKRIIGDVLELFIKKDGKVYLKRFKKEGTKYKFLNIRPVKIHRKGLLESRRSGITDGKKEYEINSKEYQLLPSSIDYSNSKYLPYAGEQLDNGCVGWAVGYYLKTYQEARERDINIKAGGFTNNAQIFSPAYIYNQINGGEDDGSTLEDAGILLKNSGAAVLSDFSLLTGEYKVKPDYATVRKAYKYRNSGYTHLFSRNEDGDKKIATIKSYLGTGELPVVGIRAGYNWEEPVRDLSGRSIIIEDETVIGRHAVIVTGYDDNFETPNGKGAFRILNSWGKDWGDDGFSYVSYEAMKMDSLDGYGYEDMVKVGKKQRNEAYIDGYKDGNFMPDQNITRAELAKAIVKLGNTPLESGNIFEDISSDHWARNYIFTAYKNKYIKGYPDGSFKPDEPIKRGEFAYMVYNYMGDGIPKGKGYWVSKTLEDIVNYWGEAQVNVLYSMNLITGYEDGSFKPESYITRAEASSLLNRVAERTPDKKYIDSLDKTFYNDLSSRSSKHWGYYDILSASRDHVLEYSYADGTMLENWENIQ